MSGISKIQTSRKGDGMDTLIDYILILLGCLWYIGALIVIINFIERRMKK